MGPLPFERLSRENVRDLPPLCTDGAWGTELQRRGARPGELTDRWNISAPDAVRSVAAAYVEAGAQVILTNTFSSNRVALAAHGLAEEAALLSRAGAAISRDAAAGRAYVVGSIGPTGKLIALRNIDAPAIGAAAAEQASALADGGADAIVVETQVGLEEARAALAGALGGCALPIGLSFVFDSGKTGLHTMLGVGIAAAVRLAESEGASFVGANCGTGIEAMARVAEAFAEAGCGLPVWIKANAGLPVLGANGVARYAETPELFAEQVPRLLAAGVRFLGGCCGSTPEHVAAIAATFK